MPKVQNTLDKTVKPSLVMLIYGEGGVGKSTTASTALRPIMADCEGGTKYFGLRGIEMPYMLISKWADMKDFFEEARKPEYETIVIDPIGELMEKLQSFMISQGDAKLVQRDGTPSQAGWGWLKNTLRSYVKAVRDLGKNVVIIAHVDEVNDEGRLVKRPRVQTKLSKDLVDMCDVVGYMTTVHKEGETKRIIYVDPESDKFVAKDRSGQLPKIVKPDVKEISEVCAGAANKYEWAKKSDKTEDEPQKSKSAELNEKAQQAVKA